MGTINIYSTEFMMEALRNTPPLHTFIKDTFFSQIKTFYTERVMFDVVKGGMAMAPFVSPRIGSKVLERQGYKTMEYTPPLVAPKRVLTTDDIDIRLPGEQIFNGYHPDKRKAQLLTEDLIDLDNSITRQEEWMCCMVLFHGKIIIIGEGVSDVIDFDFENNIVIDASKTWDNHKDSKPLDNLHEATEIVAESGLTADVAISDVQTMRHLIRNEEIKDFVDRKNYNMGVIDPKRQKNGVMYFGYLTEPGLHLYGYNAKYADNDNENPDYVGVRPGDKDFIPAVYPLIPKGKVFVGSTSMKAKMLYGLVKDLKVGSYAKERVPKRWDQDEPSESYLKISSRPLPCPQDLESWVTLDVLK